MDESIQRAERFLTAISERADRARIALENDDWDAFDDAMKWKNAAFHNFRAIDYVLQAKEPNYLMSERWQQFWTQIRNSETELSLAIENYQKNLNQTLLKLRKTKRAVSRYHSGNADSSGFIDGV
ncbi:MAG: hypothetical protein EOP10_20530 [Proteobacteria bacterium]|nr:MAG: hypothetical protein EOP10_20530 [Pseudomonadota bacterium]